MAAYGVGPAIQEEGPRNREPLFSSKGIEADLVCQHFDNFRGRQDDLVPFFKSLSKSRDEQDALIVTGEEYSFLIQLRPHHLQDLNKFLGARICKQDLFADSRPAGTVSPITRNGDDGDIVLYERLPRGTKICDFSLRCDRGDTPIQYTARIVNVATDTLPPTRCSRLTTPALSSFGVWRAPTAA